MCRGEQAETAFLHHRSLDVVSDQSNSGFMPSSVRTLKRRRHPAFLAVAIDIGNRVAPPGVEHAATRSNTSLMNFDGARVGAVDLV